MGSNNAAAPKAAWLSSARAPLLCPACMPFFQASRTLQRPCGQHAEAQACPGQEGQRVWGCPGWAWEEETRAQWPLPPETQAMARTGALEGSRPPIRQSPLTLPLPGLQPTPLNRTCPEGGECSYISPMHHTSQLTHQPCSQGTHWSSLLEGSGQWSPEPKTTHTLRPSLHPGVSPGSPGVENPPSNVHLYSHYGEEYGSSSKN